MIPFLKSRVHGLQKLYEDWIDNAEEWQLCILVCSVIAVSLIVYVALLAILIGYSGS